MPASDAIINGGFNALLAGAVVWQAKAMLNESQANRQAFTEAMELAKQAFESEVAKCHEERAKLTDKLINIATRPHNQRQGDPRA